MSEDWLDIGEKPVAGLPAIVAIPSDPAERVALVEACWSRLTDAQKRFLTALRECRMNARAANKALHGRNMTNSAHTLWMLQPDYATIVRLWRGAASDKALDKDRLLARQDDIVETLLTPKPVLYQGEPTGFEEVEAAGAARANETLMKAAGLLKDKELEVNVGLVGPSLVIQVVQPGGDVVDVTPRNVPIALPEPEEWVDA